MADLTSEPEDTPSQEDPEASASSASVASASVEPGAREEDRRKFREALERKRANEMSASAGGRGKDAGKIHGSHGPAHARRSFRRKSGS